MLKIPAKKSGIHLSIQLKRQKHPWDIAAEIAKSKHLEQTAKTETAKPYRKNLFNFSEGPSSQLSEILVTPEELGSDQNEEGNLQMFNEQEDVNEGFFLCPACTCWFTNKKDLDFHTKRWCDRQGQI